MESLLSDIELFMTTHGLTATRFGQLSLGDKHLVRQMRNGRRLWPETEAKVRQFMLTYRAQEAA